MKDTSQKSLQALILGEENGEIRFSITRDDQGVIRTTHRPDFVFHIIGAVAALALGFILYGSQGFALPIIVLPKAVEYYQFGMNVSLDFGNGLLKVADQNFNFAPLPDKLMEILKKKGLVNWIKGI